MKKKKKEMCGCITSMLSFYWTASVSETGSYK